MSTNEPMTDERLAEARVALDEDMSQWGGEYGAALLVEVERLRARLTVDDAMVEQAARAFYEHLAPGVDVSLRPSWDKLVEASPDVADAYRAGVRAALNAVRGTEGES